MEEAYSGESRRGGALEKAVHGEGLRRGGGARGGLEAEAQRLGTVAKWVCGWPEELVEEGIGEWLTVGREFLEDHDHHVIGPRQACENMRGETKAENDHESEFHNKRLTPKHDQEWAG